MPSQHRTVRPLGALTLLCVAMLTIMVGCVIVPGLPGIAHALGVSNGASWLVTLPSLGVVVFGTVIGGVMKRLGLRAALCLGLALYGALGVIGIALTHPVLLYADRFLLGGATALVMASGTGLIAEFYDGHKRLAMIAKQGMAIELGGVIFLAIGGVLAGLGWQWPFLLYLFAWVFLAMVLAFVPRPEGAAPDPSEGTVVPPESSAPVPMADIYAAALVSMILFFTAVILLPRHLAGIGFTEDQTGYFMAFISLTAVGAASLLPRLQRRLGSHPTLCLAFVAYAVAHGLFATEVLPAMIVGAVVMGCGFGTSIPLVNHMVVERSPAGRRSQALAYLSVAIFLGQFLSSAMDYVPGSGRAAFSVAVALAVVMAALYGVLALHGTRRGAAPSKEHHKAGRQLKTGASLSDETISG